MNNLSNRLLLCTGKLLIKVRGYKHELTLKHPSIQTSDKNSRHRKRNITWYNPPFSKNVATNVGQSFLRIIDEKFPAKHPLLKIFNHNTVKVSYSCMPNIKQTIDRHNKSKYYPNHLQLTKKLRVIAKRKLNALCRTSVRLSQSYIKLPESQPPIKRPTSLLKHILDSQKIISKQDTQNTKRRLIPTTNVISLS